RGGGRNHADRRADQSRHADRQRRHADAERQQQHDRRPRQLHRHARVRADRCLGLDGDRHDRRPRLDLGADQYRRHSPRRQRRRAGVLNAATVSLNGLAVTEPNGTVIATTEFDGTANSFALAGTNTIAALGTVTASTGDLAIADTSALNVIGTVTASAGNIWLESAAAGGITIAAGGTVDAVAGRLGLQADALSNQGSLIAGNGTLEFAPDTAGGTMSLGGTSFA